MNVLMEQTIVMMLPFVTTQLEVILASANKGIEEMASNAMVTIMEII